MAAFVLQNINANLRPQRALRDRQNHIEGLNNIELYDRYRFSRERIVFIEELIWDDICHDSARNNPLSPMEQLLITLRFYASGSFQQVSKKEVYCMSVCYNGLVVLLPCKCTSSFYHPLFSPSGSVEKKYTVDLDLVLFTKESMRFTRQLNTRKQVSEPWTFTIHVKWAY